MNYKIILLLFIGLVLGSCEKEKPLVMYGESLTENDLDICAGENCPEITINYIQAEGDGEVAKKINNRIKDLIVSTLSYQEDLEAAKTVEEAARNFVESYRADKASFPDMAADYFAQIHIEELYRTEKIICFEARQYMFTGGAHGYGTTSFLNIDPETGDELTENEIFKDKQDFTALAEKKFREQHNIQEGQNINEPGFWFEDDVFKLPNSVGFTQDSLIFVYNQYDIASYAEGPIELKLSKEEVKPFLKIE